MAAAGGLPDLNIDLGELPDEPPELYALADRVNIACGGHAGDPASMRLACGLAREAGAAVGAHPSYPDPAHFGRLALALPADALRAALTSQCAALKEAAEAAGARVVHAKAHGALYHSANGDRALAALVAGAIRGTLGEIALLGPPDGELRRAAEAAGLPFLPEGFADCGYGADGQLLPRGTSGALIDDPAGAAVQALSLARSGRFATVCVHADTPHAVAVARAVRAALDGA